MHRSRLPRGVKCAFDLTSEGAANRPTVVASDPRVEEDGGGGPRYHFAAIMLIRARPPSPGRYCVDAVS